jgi:hypothetical protein
LALRLGLGAAHPGMGHLRADNFVFAGLEEGGRGASPIRGAGLGPLVGFAATPGGPDSFGRQRPLREAAEGAIAVLDAVADAAALDANAAAAAAAAASPSLQPSFEAVDGNFSAEIIGADFEEVEREVMAGTSTPTPTRTYGHSDGLGGGHSLASGADRLGQYLEQTAVAQ